MSGASWRAYPTVARRTGLTGHAGQVKQMSHAAYPKHNLSGTGSYVYTTPM